MFKEEYYYFHFATQSYDGYDEGYLPSSTQPS